MVDDVDGGGGGDNDDGDVVVAVDIELLVQTAQVVVEVASLTFVAEVGAVFLVSELSVASSTPRQAPQHLESALLQQTGQKVAAPACSKLLYPTQKSREQSRSPRPCCTSS